MPGGSKSKDVWILGRAYDLSYPSASQQFKARIRTLPWFTYRRGFEAIGGTSFQTDAGWGCMLRCGQMMLAETLLRYCHEVKNPEEQAHTRREVISKFADVPIAPFSIHKVSLRGHIMDKGVGSWFGPNAMAQVMKSLTSDLPDFEMHVHVAMDGCLSKPDVEKNAKGGSDWKPLFLLVPLRLGMQKINSEYVDGLKHFFTLKQCVGAIGGRPNAAYYFVGAVENDLIYLDPHILQTTTGPITRHTSLETYSVKAAERMSISSADPSLCLGFLCHTEAEFEDLTVQLQAISRALFSVVEDSLASFSLEESTNAVEAVDGEDGDDDDGFELL